MQYAPDFETQMHALLGAEELPAFFEALKQAPGTALRLNPYKPLKTLPFEGMQPLAWTRYGYALEQRPAFTADPRFHAGAYYVQESSSMFLERAIEQLLPAERPVCALDLCAAPGGKSTHLLNCLPRGSFLAANEPVSNRVPILAENLQKWGSDRVLVCQNQPEELARLWPERFDVVVVDAPCSGEGLFRKMPEFAAQWSLRQVQGCALRQRAILQAAWQLLRPGGLLIYSTCTFNTDENEAQAAWLIAECGAEGLRIEAQPEWGVVERAAGGAYVYRFFPHRCPGEGFALSALRKSGEPNVRGGGRSKSAELPKGWTRLPGKQLQAPFWKATALDHVYQNPQGQLFAWAEQYHHLICQALPGLRLWYAGLHLGESTGREIKPSAALALQAERPELLAEAPRAELDAEQALTFLRAEALPAQPALPSGWVLATYQGLPLGWLKQTGNRCNNYHPKHWRIRHL